MKIIPQCPNSVYEEVMCLHTEVIPSQLGSTVTRYVCISVLKVDPSCSCLFSESFMVALHDSQVNNNPLCTNSPSLHPLPETSRLARVHIHLFTRMIKAE